MGSPAQSGPSRLCNFPALGFPAAPAFGLIGTRRRTGMGSLAEERLLHAQ